MFWLTLSKLKQRLFDPASISGLDVTPDYTKDRILRGGRK